MIHKKSLFLSSAVLRQVQLHGLFASIPQGSTGLACKNGGKYQVVESRDGVFVTIGNDALLADEISHFLAHPYAVVRIGIEACGSVRYLYSVKRLAADWGYL